MRGSSPSIGVCPTGITGWEIGMWGKSLTDFYEEDSL